MNIKSFFAAIIGLSFSHAACSGPPTITNVQTVSGNCNIVFNAVDSSAFKSLAPQYCSNFSATRDAAGALVKIERYIEASNPTKLALVSANIERWGMDDEDYLTLSLNNTSNLPAEKVGVRFLASPLKPGDRTPRQIKFTPSRAIPSAVLKNLSIASKDTQEIPVAPVSELERYTRTDIPADYDLIGVGISPDIPEDTIQQYIRNHGITHGYSYNSAVVGLGVQTLYETVFGGKVTLLAGIYCYYMKIVAVPPVDAISKIETGGPD